MLASDKIAPAGFRRGYLMRRTIIATVLLILFGWLAWEYVPINIWDGAYDLRVHVESETGAVQAVRCVAVPNRDAAEEVLQQPDSVALDPSSVTADPFTGHPIMVAVHVSGRDTPSGRVINRGQYRYLAVIARMSDGRTISKAVEIPDGRTKRELRLALP